MPSPAYGLIVEGDYDGPVFVELVRKVVPAAEILPPREAYPSGGGFPAKRRFAMDGALVWCNEYRLTAEEWRRL